MVHSWRCPASTTHPASLRGRRPKLESRIPHGFEGRSALIATSHSISNGRRAPKNRQIATASKYVVPQRGRSLIGQSLPKIASPVFELCSNRSRQRSSTLVGRRGASNSCQKSGSKYPPRVTKSSKSPHVTGNESIENDSTSCRWCRGPALGVVSLPMVYVPAGMTMSGNERIRRIKLSNCAMRAPSQRSQNPRRRPSATQLPHPRSLFPFPVPSKKSTTVFPSQLVAPSLFYESLPVSRTAEREMILRPLPPAAAAQVGCLASARPLMNPMSRTENGPWGR